jgi:hypothetical protein
MLAATARIQSRKKDDDAGVNRQDSKSTKINEQFPLRQQYIDAHAQLTITSRAP